MSQDDRVSDTVSLLCALCVGEGSERGQCCCLASGVLSRRKLSLGTCPDARHFRFSLYATGVLPATAPVLEP